MLTRIQLLLSSLLIAVSLAVSAQDDARYATYSPVPPGYDQVALSIGPSRTQAIAYWNRHLEGDSLFVLVFDGSDYRLSLRTLNFTQDGLFRVQSVGTEQSGYLVVRTVFNGSGGMKCAYFLSFGGDTWKLVRTEVESTTCRSEKECYLRTCTLAQNLTLDAHTDWKLMRQPEQSRKKECTETRL